MNGAASSIEPIHDPGTMAPAMTSAVHRATARRPPRYVAGSSPDTCANATVRPIRPGTATQGVQNRAARDHPIAREGHDETAKASSAPITRGKLWVSVPKYTRVISLGSKSRAIATTDAAAITPTDSIRHRRFETRQSAIMTIGQMR